MKMGGNPHEALLEWAELARQWQGSNRLADLDLNVAHHEELREHEAGPGVDKYRVRMSQNL